MQMINKSSCSILVVTPLMRVNSADVVMTIGMGAIVAVETFRMKRGSMNQLIEKLLIGSSAPQHIEFEQRTMEAED